MCRPLLQIFRLLVDCLQRGVAQGELKADFDAKLVAEIIWDVYVANYRRAIYDSWSAEALLERLTRQLGVILAGVRV